MLNRTYPFSNNFLNWGSNSFSSIGTMRYGEIDIGSVPDCTSIANSISRLRASPSNSFGNTSRNSQTIGTSSTLNMILRTWPNKSQIRLTPSMNQPLCPNSWYVTSYHNVLLTLKTELSLTKWSKIYSLGKAIEDSMPIRKLIHTHNDTKLPHI